MKKRRIRINIIGHFGGKHSFFDGQTVKTVTLYNELIKTNKVRVTKTDTYLKHKHPLFLFIVSLLNLLFNKRTIILLSKNGMNFYFPLCSFFSRFFHKLIFHDVVGGDLDEIIKENPKLLKYLSSFRANFVETDGLKKRLEDLGLTNCVTIPNFKRLHIQTTTTYNDNIFKFCTFSRVIREKGIEEAILAIDSINKSNGCILCLLDIYGPVDFEFEERFYFLISEHKECVKYKGIVDFSDSSNVLKDYFALLFPTRWYGEGFPGTIVDAFSAGTPVIATDWRWNSEIIVDGKNGFLYPSSRFSTLEEAITWSINNKDFFNSLRLNCLRDASDFMPDKHIDLILDIIQK